MKQHKLTIIAIEQENGKMQIGIEFEGNEPLLSDAIAAVLKTERRFRVMIAAAIASAIDPDHGNIADIQRFEGKSVPVEKGDKVG